MKKKNDHKFTKQYWKILIILSTIYSYVFALDANVDSVNASSNNKVLK
jgi:hypothetical protein